MTGNSAASSEIRQNQSGLDALVEECLRAAQSATVFDGDFYRIEGMSGRRYRHFINHLIAALPNATYLEVGLWAGSTFCSAISGNKVRAFGVDSWAGIAATEGRIIPAPRDEFFHNLKSTLKESPRAAAGIIEGDFHTVNYRGFPCQFNVFMFDGPHSTAEQTDGIRLALPALRDEFVLIVDDWNWPEVRAGTRAAIQECGLTAISEWGIRTNGDGVYGPEQLVDPWHNGCFIGVLHK